MDYVSLLTQLFLTLAEVGSRFFAVFIFLAGGNVFWGLLLFVLFAAVVLALVSAAMPH